MFSEPVSGFLKVSLSLWILISEVVRFADVSDPSLVEEEANEETQEEATKDEAEIQVGEPFCDLFTVQDD
ncbi:hypothetical protein MUK42_32840 [Musa troglodytarum]|uniref:Uncharacterized protein n=1 Tax=Musa troglodytarum TaxID=320322 RepID=A0A9E7K9A0_9LILI|nr:hypothetical protein MUK42_32840 [Musa troglodytarum]